MHINQYINQLKELCNEYNYHMEEFYDGIHIDSQFENWNVVVCEGEHIKLFHGNTLGKGNGQYHKQFSRRMNAKQLVEYIHQHVHFRYIDKRDEKDVYLYTSQYLNKLSCKTQRRRYNRC